MHPHALLQAKRAVNQTLNARGQMTALEAAFDIHSLGHANAWVIGKSPILGDLASMTEGNRAAQKA
jgi:enoyl-CoA hydratase